MLPKTLSATSLQVASLCMARWKAEYLERTPGFSGFAANIGTTCHGALEHFVKAVYIEKTHQPSWDLLVQFYQIAYIETFQSADFDTPEYKDGIDLVKKWYKRTSFDGFQVESCEVKETIEIPVMHNGEKVMIPFNYIMDRVDQISETEFRVVDYKSVRMPIQPDELEGKIQARAYALAIQIKHPEAQKIRVVFDLLRYDPVGIIVTKEDNIAFWKYLKQAAQRIVDMDEDDVKPTLNLECGFCVIKATCPLMTKNVLNGGVHSLSMEELVQKKLELEAQAKGGKYLLEEIEELLLKEAYNRDELSWQVMDGAFQVDVTMSRRRQVDASEVARIIGPDLFSKLGSITLGILDDLIKDPALSEDQQQALKKLIYYKNGDPKAKVKQITKLV